MFDSRSPEHYCKSHKLLLVNDKKGADNYGSKYGYKTIMKAMTDAVAGDTIQVGPGRYDYAILKPGVTLQGQGRVTIENLSTATGQNNVLTYISGLTVNVSKAPLMLNFPIQFDNVIFNITGSNLLGGLTGVTANADTVFRNCQIRVTWSLANSAVAVINNSRGELTLTNNIININTNSNVNVTLFKVLGNTNILNNQIRMINEGGNKIKFIELGPNSTSYIQNNLILGTNNNVSQPSSFELGTNVDVQFNKVNLSPTTGWYNLPTVGQTPAQAQMLALQNYNNMSTDAAVPVMWNIRNVNYPGQLLPTDTTVIITATGSGNYLLPQSNGNNVNKTQPIFINNASPVRQIIVAPPGNGYKGNQVLSPGQTAIVQAYGTTWYRLM